MKVLFATSEIAPWVKTGGLGDVSGALPHALQAQGCDLRLLVPAYPALLQAFPDAREVARPHGLGGLLPSCRLLEAIVPGEGNGLTLWLLDYPPYFDRPGNPYLGPEGHDWLDNHLRFGLLSRIAAWLGCGENTTDWHPDVVHCHDWQTALAPVFLTMLPGRRARTVVTVHNLAFQGLFGHAALYELGLPASAWSMHGVEYHGYLSFLKGGLQHADWITTVSPTYAREIRTEAEGMGLAGLLRHRAKRLTGILNGIDLKTWDPARDTHLVKTYDAAHLGNKAENKLAAQRELGLEQRADLPLLGVVSRLTEQKGLDLVLAIAASLAARSAQLAILGSGDKEMEQSFRELSAQWPGRVAARIGFDEALAHRIEAGADIFLMPSRFEPCGLNQMYSLRYGTPPVVRATGGLADTVIDATDAKHGNGFVFAEPSAAALATTVDRAIAAWHDKKHWRAIQKRAMSGDFGWDGPARRYVQIYERLARLQSSPVKALTLIAAVARSGVIGRDNKLLWHLPEDMQRFKALTTGHAVIMGRKTWESLPEKFRPLPRRHNIVVTRDTDYQAIGATVAHSMEEALAAAGEDDAFVIGGEQIYTLALPLATRLELTEIDADFDGDAFFPAFDHAMWHETAREKRVTSDDLHYDFVTYVRS